VEWPLTYPGAIPGDSYLFLGDTFEPLAGPVPVGARTALVACGSNASPDRLRAKFDGSGVDPRMPVLRATVDNAASVYSRHISRYGAIPATLMRIPSAASELFVQLVDDDQLALIADSERRSYTKVSLDPAVHPVTLASGEVLDECWCFASTFGALLLDGRPVGLAAFPAVGVTAMTHADLWTAIAARWAAEHPLLPSDPVAIMALVADEALVRSAFDRVTTAGALDLAEAGGTN
jgi:hypothetical protein